MRGEGDVGIRRDPGPGSGRREKGLSATGAERRRPGLDVLVVPSLLLLLARDLLVLDPPRVLAWRLLHEPRLSELPSFLAALVPRPRPEIDRDPIALVLATLAAAFAALYLAGAISGRGPRFRLAVVLSASLALVVAPTVGFMAMGWALDRPYGQDGGVVQLPLALDKILAGESPYAADYSDSILARQERSSRFWATRGGNPILRHHAYLPGTHVLAMPFHLACRAAGVVFDPRLLTLLAYALAAWMAARLPTAPDAKLAGASLVLLNPLVYWHQIFGANDIVFVAMVLAAAWLVTRGRVHAAAAVIGLACATKQLAWPFAPFLLLVASGARWPLARADLPRLAKRFAALGAIAAAVFAVVVLPVAALDFRAFYADIVGYNVGLPGADNYPLGGTPGFGFANFLIYFGAVSSLGDYFPFGVFYLLLVPLGLLLVAATLRRAEPGRALAAGAAALLASLYFSRVVHPNYVAPLAVILPVAALLTTLAADVVLVPLLLAAVAVEIAELGPLRLLWEDALAVRLPAHATGLAGTLMPRGGPALTDDPLSLAWSATAAGVAAVYLGAGLAGLGPRFRAGIAALAVVLVTLAPAWVVVATGGRTGVARAQDEWVADAAARDSRPSVVREAWSSSFRGEPARLLSADARPQWSLAGLLTSSDPRLLSIVAVGVAVALLLLRRPIDRAAIRLAVWLSPPAVSAVAFGAAHGLGLALLLIALAVACRFPAARVPAVSGAALLWLAFAARVPEIGPGYGIVNLWTYAGHAPSAVVLVVAGLIVSAAVVWAARRALVTGLPPAIPASLALTAALLLAPAASPDAALAPLGLLLLGALDEA